VIALPHARVAVMGAEAAINAVYANRIEAIEDADERDRFVEEKRAEYEEDVDLLRLASELVVDAVVPASHLRRELVVRLEHAADAARPVLPKRHGVPPV
jgi:acetyl-CoA carboxylase carboxyltransferase component